MHIKLDHQSDHHEDYQLDHQKDRQEDHPLDHQEDHPLDYQEGPLDLLLGLIQKNEFDIYDIPNGLIKKNKIDIYDIPMAKLTEQYLEAIRELPPDMEDMSGFLVMAATLLEIKSRLLLPQAEDKEDEEDPREELERRLEVYQHYKMLAITLKDSPDAGARLFKQPEYPMMAKSVSTNPADWLSEVTADNLWEIFADVMKRQARKVDAIRHNFGKIPKDRHTITEKIGLISKALKERKHLQLSELFAQCLSKEECLVTFLAVLEMIRRNQAAVQQKSTFGEIIIRAM